MEFDQRPKLEDYDDFVPIVSYGARGLDEKLLEVRCFYAEHFFVSVHRHPAAAIGDARAVLAGCPPTGGWSRSTGCSTPSSTACSRS